MATSTTDLSRAGAPPGPVALPISGAALAAEIAALGVTHLITVPDTNLKTTIAALESQARVKMLYVCTEDEGMGINAGLYMAGQKPMMLIQNNGLYACVNTLKAIALDAAVPTCMLIGQFGRDATKSIEENRLRAVRLLEPTLAVWGVPSFRLEKPEEIGNLRLAYERAWADRAPTAAIVGVSTS